MLSTMDTVKEFGQAVKVISRRVLKGFGYRSTKGIVKGETLPQQQLQPSIDLKVSNSNTNTNTNNNTNTINAPPSWIINNTTISGGGQEANHQNNGSTNDVPSLSIETPTTGSDALKSGGTIVEPHQSNDHRLLQEATNQYKELLANEPNPPIEKITQTGVVPRLVEILSRDDLPQLQFEAVAALTEITVCNSVNINNLATDHGVIPVLVKLLDSPNDDIREKATWALGRIAGDSSRCRDLVLDNEALPPLLAELNESAKPSLLEKALHTPFFCCVKEPFDKIKTALPALGAVMQLSDDEEILTRACNTLRYLCDRKYGNSQAVIEAGAFPWLLKLLQHPSPKVLYNALNTVQRIVDRDTIKVQAAIDANIIGPVVHLLQHVDSNVKSRAADVIRDAVSCGTCEQIKYFVSQGCIKPLCDLLICSDEGIVMSCVDGLNNILKAGEAGKNSGSNGSVNLYAQMITEAGGWKEIKNLQSHGTEYIKKKAVKILKTYIGHEYED